MKPMKRIGGNPSKLNGVRNPEGIFINTAEFSRDAQHFMKNGYYTPDPWGSPSWMDYWTEQLRRCVEGYSVGGVKITGYHYGYLNFAPIQRLDMKTAGTKAAKKIKGFPDFWDGDYNYFHAKEIARFGISPDELEKLRLSVRIRGEHLIGGKHMIVGKARRKGYSFKNGWICANNYNTIRDSLSLITAFDKKFLYPKGTMGMASAYLNFLNESTGWRKSRDYVDKQEARRASYKKIIEGVPIESGYMSEIMAITFKDNPDAARGKDPYEVLMEEAGAWPNLMDSYMAIEPSVTAGNRVTGQITIFGTGGDMEGGTRDFAHMYYNPLLFNLMPFENIWDEDAENSECGFFHPMQWNREGYYDSNGNSDAAKALIDEAKHREEMKANSSSGSAVLQKRVQEYPTCPAEAFLTVSHNNFPVIELRNRANKVKREGLDKILEQPVYLYRDELGKIRARPDMTSDLKPIWGRLPLDDDKKGAVLIREYPIPNAPKGLYKIGYDPYAQDEGTSMGAIYVYKSTHKNSHTRNTLVARYVGRPGDADECNRIFEMLCELYNTQGMHENMVLHVKSYFLRRKKLHLLAAQPDQVISQSIKNSGVRRVYGCHMDDKLKEAGEKYIKTWLLSERDMDENGNILTNIDMITDLGLLEELIMYNRKGNFDRVMALMMVMIQEEEEELEKAYSTNEEEITNRFLDIIPELFKKN